VIPYGGIAERTHTKAGGVSPESLCPLLIPTTGPMSPCQHAPRQLGAPTESCRALNATGPLRCTPRSHPPRTHRLLSQLEAVAVEAGAPQQPVQHPACSPEHDRNPTHSPSPCGFPANAPAHRISHTHFNSPVQFGPPATTFRSLLPCHWFPSRGSVLKHTYLHIAPWGRQSYHLPLGAGNQTPRVPTHLTTSGL
jgi:hypothetical protein